MIKRNAILFAVLAGALGTLTSQMVLSNNSVVSKNGSIKSELPRPVPTAQVFLFKETRQLSFPGTVQAHSRVELAFNVDGQLVESNIVEGAPFKKGEVLARLDQRDFQHSYDAALAKTRRLEKEYDRVKKLHDQKVISQAEYDVAKSNHDVAQAELRIRKKAIQDTVLHAPFDGVVAKRYAQNFQHIKAKDSILSFKDISLIDVVIQVPERLMATTAPGAAKDITVIFEADREKAYQGNLKEHSMQSDPVSRTYDTVIGVNLPEAMNIFPGMTATVNIKILKKYSENPYTTGSTSIGGFIVPVEAVFRSDGNVYCWIIQKKGGKPEKRRVEIGEMCNEGILIRQGLAKGEHVAIAGLHVLHEELNVRPANDNWEGLDG